MGALYMSELLVLLGSLAWVALLFLLFVLLWGLSGLIVFGYIYHSPLEFVKRAKIHNEEEGYLATGIHIFKDMSKMFLFGPFGFFKKYRIKICPKCFG